MIRKLLLLCLLFLASAKAFSQENGVLPFLKIYPNPASNYLTITNDVPIKKVVIVNMLGQVVYKENVNAQVVKINIAHLPPGMYYAQMDDYKSMKLVKE